jgi:hypothetical protein
VTCLYSAAVAAGLTGAPHLLQNRESGGSSVPPRPAQLVEVLHEVGPLEQLDHLARGPAHQQPGLPDVSWAEFLGLQRVAELAQGGLAVEVVS